MSQWDREWMAQALALGATAEGSTSPNPRVGCLIVRDGTVVGCGIHCAPGRPHAEVMALAAAGAHARGATLYVNLEPCAHHGRTPPCVHQVVESGIARVVVAMQDPDPRVNGRGLEHLRAAGLRVDLGLLAEEAARLNAAFVRWHRTGLPLVTLKAAASLDGMLAANEGRSRWITGKPSRRFAHRLRLRHDAILVGAETVRRDDPRLTVRLGGSEVVRPRVVLSGSLRLDPAARVFAGAQPEGPATLIYTASLDNTPTDALRRVAEIVTVPDSDGALDLEAVLHDLGRRGMQSVLVEGGGATLAAFLRSGLAQQLALFRSGRILGTHGATPMIDDRVVEQPGHGWRADRRQSIPLGDDLLWLGGLHPPGEV